ncbi:MULTISPECIES: PPC domain-containing DNA-binding protein [unclassified Leptolyngbya]|uniref:PPC domain-containing DNA-binding protein n=1 Tax=unclassified Leptolyngbya TaxID=2650499 RepID=UPI0016876A29|nr:MULTISPECIES: PPC domain-containing DNA-binding protein [unclassified Leptolyngbya]MBD1909512.1 DNA-binding protein [Leptolyngbya sp. FACHB-8]MBD2159003.1 DNA-binding protein [Leptolyngbya sp. FACHB-16]
MLPTPLHAIALRLCPGQDLRLELDALVQKKQWKAACVLTCVGSLTRATLRLAGQLNGTTYQGPFEIVSLTGVMGVAGSHYHMAIANSTGQTLGGHVLPGCCIYTTAELVIGVLPALHFTRELCSLSGYSELKVCPHEKE